MKKRSGYRGRSFQIHLWPFVYANYLFSKTWQCIIWQRSPCSVPKMGASKCRFLVLQNMTEHFTIVYIPVGFWLIAATTNFIYVRTAVTRRRLVQDTISRHSFPRRKKGWAILNTTIYIRIWKTLGYPIFHSIFGSITFCILLLASTVFRSNIMVRHIMPINEKSKNMTKRSAALPNTVLTYRSLF